MASRTSVTLDSNRSLWLGILASFLFTLIIWTLGGRLEQIRLLPDSGAAWYYWRLPNPTFWSRLSAWVPYLLHQAAIWGLIYYAQSKVNRYSARLQPIHLWTMAVNAFFIFLHLLQTHLFYDGLAQDMAVWTSQGSVILLLVFVLLMENARRGLIWGKKVPINQQIIQVVKRYHGYLFSWAIVYTFWFHPMVATSGHLIGFFYMFLLMLQGSLFYTPIHLNQVWTTILEVLVLAHGTLVAVMNTNGLWPMFFFGFLGIFVITQMHAFSLSQILRWMILGLYVLAALAVYGAGNLADIHQVTWIPLIEYLAVFLLALLIWLGLQVFGKPQPPLANQRTDT